MKVKYYGPIERAPRGEPHQIVAIPVYESSKLLSILCKIFPSNTRLIKQVVSVSNMLEYTTVVEFTETMGVCLVDLEKELVKGSDAVEFWTEIQNKIQLSAWNRLKPVRFKTLSFNGEDLFEHKELPPVSNDKITVETDNLCFDILKPPFVQDSPFNIFTKDILDSY